MRRILLLVAALVLAACGADREPLEFPAEPQGRLLTPTPTTTGGTGPAAPTAPTISTADCPVDEPRMCQEASALANALAQTQLDAVLTLSRPTTVECADVDPEIYPQCEDEDSLDGYVVAGAEPEIFVVPQGPYRNQLEFMADGLDPEYSDEYGTGEYRLLGIATCEPQERYQLVYLVGLGDPNSTLPADRFLGTFELTEQDGGWAISLLTLDILSDWQLYLDDPLVDVGCGRIESWGD